MHLVRFLLLLGFAWLGLFNVLDAAEPARRPFRPEDVLRLESFLAGALSPTDERLAVIHARIDPASQEERFTLKLVDQPGVAPRPLEANPADARSAVWSPDGRWLVIRSTRARPAGWTPTGSVPPESDPATDLWLVAADGSRTIALAGPDKPYGRVLLDPFYGRVAFAPDGRSLVFVADDGRDPRSPAEREANVHVWREDQGEGYTGFGPAQLWLAELETDPTEFAARRIRRLTNDDVWYGDPQRTPDGRQIIVHANFTSDVESARFSINKNFDLWAIDVVSGDRRRLTDGPGPEVSPRFSPNGKELICLSAPRQGPHADVFNVLRVSLDPAHSKPPQVVFDHHASSPAPSSPPVPSFPLPEECWDGDAAITYVSFRGTETQTVRLDLASRAVSPWPPESGASLSPAAARVRLRSKLQPAAPLPADLLVAEERVVRWTNDGLSLEGVLTIPPAEIATTPYPLIVFPHGGPHSRSTRGFNATAQAFAGAGYLVFQPNFRGSSGYGREFLDADRRDLGGGDMRDLLTGIEMLVEQKQVDPRRQFVYGVSYGGFMTTWLVGHTTQFQAAVAQNAVTDMNMMWGLSDLQSWTEWELGGKPWQVAEAMRAHSPTTFVERVATPTLLLHSREDRRCPLPMGRAFHQLLLGRGVPTGLIEYPGEGHGIKQPRHRVDVLRRTLDWFARFDPAREVSIFTLGDSITKGVRPGVKAEETFAARLEASLRKSGVPARVENVGIGGERTDQALRRLESAIVARRPALVTIMYGTNDSYVDQGKLESRLTRIEYRDNLVALVRRLRDTGIEPVLMTEPRWGASAGKNGAGEHPNERLEAYVQTCRDVAAGLHVPLVDHFALWTQRQRDGHDLGPWTTDQCHPNAEGHAVIARPIAETVLRRLQELGLAPRP